MQDSVAIVGLGYVGLPLACLCVERGMQVYGVDLNKNKLSMISKGTSPIDDPSLNQEVKKIKGKIALTDNFDEAIGKSSVVIICVPTPIDSSHLPDCLRPAMGQL